MYSRILFSIVAASALVTAAPVLANEPAKGSDARRLSPCCERLAMHVDAHGRSNAKVPSCCERLMTQLDAHRRTDAVDKATQKTEQESSSRFDEYPFVVPSDS